MLYREISGGIELVRVVQGMRLLDVLFVYNQVATAESREAALKGWVCVAESD